MKIILRIAVLIASICINNYTYGQFLLEALEGSDTVPKCTSLNTEHKYYTYVKHNGADYHPLQYHRHVKNGTLPNGRFEVGYLLPTTETNTCPREKISVRLEQQEIQCLYMTWIDTDATLITIDPPPFGWSPGPRAQNVVHLHKIYFCEK